MSRIVQLTASLSLILALGAIAASPATGAEFHSEAAHTIISGEQHAGEDTTKVNAWTFRCSHLTLTGTSESATHSTLRVAPVYSNCKINGAISMVIDVNGCEYVLHAGSGGGTSSTSIDCPAGQSMTTTSFNCWITIGSQGPLSGTTYTNQGSGANRDLTIDQNISGFTYTQHSKSFPGCTNGTFNNGTYTGSATFRDFNTVGEQIGIWVQ